MPIFAASAPLAHSRQVGTQRQNRFAESFRESGRALACSHQRAEGVGMARERGRLFRWANSMVYRGEHLRNGKEASKSRRPQLFQTEQGLACALALLFIFRPLRQVLVFGAAGAALVLLLQQLVDPTPLFWSAPWEALQLVLSRRQRLNHAWLHRRRIWHLNRSVDPLKPMVLQSRTVSS